MNLSQPLSVVVEGDSERIMVVAQLNPCVAWNRVWLRGFRLPVSASGV